MKTLTALALPFRGSLLAGALLLAACAGQEGRTTAVPDPGGQSVAVPLTIDEGDTPVAAAPAPARVEEALAVQGAKRERVANEVLVGKTKGAMAPAAMALMAQDAIAWQPPEPYNERYQTLDDNPVKQVAADPVSTFSLDVDTGSYANVRRLLNAGRLPPKDAVKSPESY